MATRQLRVLSYFSLETDLAAEFRVWDEFVEGDGYDVTLESTDGAERVTVRMQRPDDEAPFVAVRGEGEGVLFECVVGRTAYVLAAHSDHLMIDRDE